MQFYSIIMTNTIVQKQNKTKQDKTKRTPLTHQRFFNQYHDSYGLAIQAGIAVWE